MFGTENFGVELGNECKFYVQGSAYPCELLSKYDDMIIFGTEYKPLGATCDYSYYVWKKDKKNPDYYLVLHFKVFGENVAPIKIRDAEFEASMVSFSAGNPTMIDFPIYVYGKKAIVAKGPAQLDNDRVLVFSGNVVFQWISPKADRYILIGGTYIPNHKVYRKKRGKKYAVVSNEDESYLIEFNNGWDYRHARATWSFVTNDLIFVIDNKGDFPIFDKKFRQIGYFDFDEKDQARVVVDNKPLRIRGYGFQDIKLNEKYKPQAFNDIPIEVYKAPEDYYDLFPVYRLRRRRDILKQIDKIVINDAFIFLTKNNKPKYLVRSSSVFEAVGEPDITSETQYIQTQYNTGKLFNFNGLSYKTANLPLTVLKRIGYWKLIEGYL